jgi:hypothetical protein
MAMVANPKGNGGAAFSWRPFLLIFSTASESAINAFSAVSHLPAALAGLVTGKRRGEP